MDCLNGRYACDEIGTPANGGEEMPVLSLDIPWKRYGLIAELAERLEGKCPQFGKTALQKLIFLLQELYGVDCDYEFSLYTYGPYSSRLQQDLDVVETLGGVIIERVMGGAGGYCILPGDKKDALCEKADLFLQDPRVAAALDQLIADFGAYWARDLELLSTIVFVARDLKRTSKSVSRDQLLNMVHEVKLKFQATEIAEKIEELESKCFQDLYLGQTVN